MIGNLRQDIGRALALLWISLKYGLGPFARWLLGRGVDRDGYPIRVRLALEELGVTYLKLGQFLALRHDILPPELCQELNKLFENVSPMPFADARAVVEAELGGQLQEFFLSFQQEPLAAASIAQVHEARTRANERVAVKIQRLRIERIFAADMRILRRLAVLVDALQLLGRLSTTEMVDEFAVWTRREMDFLIEGRTADVVRRRAVYEAIPRVYWDLTTSRVLTTEFIDGISLAQVGQLFDRGGIDLVHAYLPNLQLDQMLHRFAFASLHQLFVSGVFHGDPHPGNILVRGASTIAFVDFGIFGTLSDQERAFVSGLVENIAIGNINESFRYYSKQLTPTDETDPRAFETEAKAVLFQWYRSTIRADSPLKERHLGRYIGEMIGVSRENHLRMGMRYLLFWRTLNALDSTAMRFPEYFDLMTELREFFTQVRPGPFRRALALATDPDLISGSVELVREIPGQIAGLLTDSTRGYGASWLTVYEAKEPLDSRSRSTRWLVVSVLVISLTVLVTLGRLGS
jgi:ubiquinone biosynthesis protein